jgi:hypothetical protein
MGVQLRKNVLYDDQDSSDVTYADDRDLNSDAVEDCIDKDETQKRNCYQPACEGNILFYQILYHSYFYFILLTFSHAKPGAIKIYNLQRYALFSNL